MVKVQIPTYSDNSDLDPNKDYSVEELAAFVSHAKKGKTVRGALAGAMLGKWGLSNNSIGEEQLNQSLKNASVFQTSISLSSSGLQANSYINWSGGNVVSNTTAPEVMYASDYIRMPESQVLLCDYAQNEYVDLRGIAFYSAEKRYLSGTAYDKQKSQILISRKVMPLAEYFRFTTEESCLDTVKLVYQNLSGKIDLLLKQSDEISQQKESKQIDLTIQTTKTDAYVRYADGGIGNYNDRNQPQISAIQWIPVLPQKKYLLSDYGVTDAVDLRGLALFDSLKSYMSGIQYTAERNDIVIDTPKEARFLSLTIGTSRLDRATLMMVGDVESDDENPSNSNPLSVIRDTPGMGRIFRKVIFLGDSLSSGEHEIVKDDGSTGYIDLFDFSFGQQAGRLLNAEAVNLSVGGLTAQTNYQAFSEKMSDPENIGTLYNIYLGTNDLYKKPYEIGTIADINQTDPSKNANTFCGWYAKIIQRIQEVQPRARITCMTLPKPAKEPDEMVTLNDAIRSIVNLYDNCYLIDLYKYAEQETSAWRRHYGSGHGHLNAMGYVRYAQYFVTYLDWIINQNPSEFLDVALIGTSETLQQPS